MLFKIIIVIIKLTIDGQNIFHTCKHDESFIYL